MSLQSNREFTLRTLEDNIYLAEIIADYIRKSRSIVCLYGLLGVGKTTIVQSIIRILIKDKSLKVTSPTFNILNIYDAGLFQIHHYDLYRVKFIEDIYEIGLYDNIHNQQNISFIEWPEIVEKILPSINRIDIKMKIEYDNRRIVNLIIYKDSI